MKHPYTDGERDAVRACLDILSRHSGHEIIRSVIGEISKSFDIAAPAQMFRVEHLHPPKITAPEVHPPQTWAEAQVTGPLTPAEPNPALEAPRSSSPPNPQTYSPLPSPEPSPKPSAASCPTAPGQPPAPAWEGTLDAAGVDSSLKAPDPRSVPVGYLPADVRLDLQSEVLQQHEARLQLLDNSRDGLVKQLALVQQEAAARSEKLQESLEVHREWLFALQNKWDSIPLAEDPPRCQSTRDFAPGQLEGELRPAEVVWAQGHWQIWTIDRKYSR